MQEALDQVDRAVSSGLQAIAIVQSPARMLVQRRISRMNTSKLGMSSLRPCIPFTHKGHSLVPSDACSVIGASQTGSGSNCILGTSTYVLYLAFLLLIVF